ncbi:putative Nuclear hormone receptor HR96 [Hypsibius exemplaris]|uniref:Nuclear hormone receptor HR96 n=1 Tax=Hypsibius exemplaris TaxID=2072580 RepID=A0A9X6NCC0_HYPEX|nr:putative Nuclear hormone receptor HR96 [Hypsibius exemplaris]
MSTSDLGSQMEASSQNESPDFMPSLERAMSGGDSPDSSYGGSPKIEKTPSAAAAAQTGNSGKTCRVCGDTALNMNFGAISCESCKAFFRRNALKKKELKCPFKGVCQIDVESRRWCQQCRLKKCFEVGMKRELIKKVKRGISEVDVDCLSNGGAHSPSTPAAEKREKLGGTDSAVSELPVVSDGILTGCVSDVWSPADSAVSSTDSPPSDGSVGPSLGAGLEMLCAFEREKIVELVRANESMMETNLEEETAVVRYPETHRLVDVINMTDIAIRRVIKMAKRITGFKNLIQEDQIALLKGACFEMMILRAVSHYNVEKDCWQGPQATMIKVDILKEAKGNCYEEIRTFIHSFAPELRKDEPLLLILGAIALFHPDRPSLELRGQIRAQQSLYYFLLHSYIRIKYGNNSVRETEALYVQMINKLDLLHLLNDRHISMFMDVNPKDVEPLLIEIFDLNMAIPVKL